MYPLLSPHTRRVPEPTREHHMFTTCGLCVYLVVAPYINACLEEWGAEELPQGNPVKKTLPWRSPALKGTRRLKFGVVRWLEKYVEFEGYTDLFAQFRVIADISLAGLLA